jgi:hydrogenase maturation protease
MKTAIVGVGNILLKDEGVGVRVVQQLATSCSLPPGITVIDGGTAGPHLLDICCKYDDIIIIDAVKGRGNPGTIYKFHIDLLSSEQSGATSLSMHDLGVPEAVSQARLLGKEPHIIIIGIEPQDISPWGMELSPLIAQKIPEVIALVLRELSQRGDGGCFDQRNQVS